MAFSSFWPLQQLNILRQRMFISRLAVQQQLTILFFLSLFLHLALMITPKTAVLLAEARCCKGDGEGSCIGPDWAAACTGKCCQERITAAKQCWDNPQLLKNALLQHQINRNGTILTDNQQQLQKNDEYSETLATEEIGDCCEVMPMYFQWSAHTIILLKIWEPLTSSQLLISCIICVLCAVLSVYFKLLRYRLSHSLLVRLPGDKNKCASSPSAGCCFSSSASYNTSLSCGACTSLQFPTGAAAISASGLCSSSSANPLHVPSKLSAENNTSTSRVLCPSLLNGEFITSSKSQHQLMVSTIVTQNECCATNDGKQNLPSLTEFRNIGAIHSNHKLNNHNSNNSSRRQQCTYYKEILIRVYCFLQSFVIYAWDYLLMLIVMTFNFWLFIAVCLGLAIGYTLLPRKTANISKENTDSAVLEVGTYSTGQCNLDPECCGN